MNQDRPTTNSTLGRYCVHWDAQCPARLVEHYEFSAVATAAIAQQIHKPRVVSPSANKECHEQPVALHGQEKRTHACRRAVPSKLLCRLALVHALEATAEAVSQKGCWSESPLTKPFCKGPVCKSSPVMAKKTCPRLCVWQPLLRMHPTPQSKSCDAGSRYGTSCLGALHHRHA